MQSTRAALLVFLVAGLVVPVSAPAMAQADAEAPTFVESNIDTDTAWTADGGPYRVTRDVTVAPGATLRVSSGTEVQLAEDVTITVKGSLIANGRDGSPVTVRMTPGAPADIRWDSIRYAGQRGSELTLRGTTLRDGTNAVTVASARGRITVEDSVFRNHSESALRVVQGAETPRITLRRSTVRDIDGHALRLTPGFGAAGPVRVTADTSSRGARSTHALSFVPGTPMTTDEIHVDYGDHGDVTDADLRALRVHTDRDGQSVRDLTPLVSSVERRDNTLVFHLENEITVAGNSRLDLRYGGVRNPETAGVYPVALRFERDNVSQLPGDVVARLAIGGVSGEYVDVRPEGPTRVSSLTVEESTFADVNGSAVFVAADRVAETRVSGTLISSTTGAGVSFRARELDGELRDNTVSVGQAGVALSVRDSATLVASGNRITGSESGIRLRQSGLGFGGVLEATLRGNVLSGNERHGVSLRGESATLSGFRIENNIVANNGESGVAIAPQYVDGGVVVANEIRHNGGDGIRFDSYSHRDTRIADNTLTANTGDGIDLSTLFSARNVVLRDNRVQDGGGHGVRLRTELLAHNARIEENLLSNNAGAGVLVSSPITHGGRVNVTNNTVAANAYGVLVEGALRATVSGNDVVFNTNPQGAVPVPGVRPGTGVWVTEGSAGAILDRSATESIADLIADPTVDPPLSTTTITTNTAVVFRTDRPSAIRRGTSGALSAWRTTEDIPTGIALSTGPEAPGPALRENDVYGHSDGLVVDIARLVDASTSARIVVDQLRTVRAERNYWGAPTGPYHTSILPSGAGNPVVTAHGWVDFVPFATNASGPTYARPEARLDAPASALPGRTVTLSGANSTSNSSSVGTYRFTVGSNESRSGSVPRRTFTMPNESVTVRLAVEDRLGIESADAATATITPAPPESTSEPDSETTTTNGSTTPSSQEDEGGISLVGLLGAIPSVVGFGLGTYGFVLSLLRRQPPISGFTVQALVISGVLIWTVAGLLTDPFLLRLGVGTALVWTAATGVAYATLKSRSAS